MKTRVGIALLALVVLGTWRSHAQQPPPHNGYWWVDESQDFKVGFANGYALAMNDDADAAGLRCLAAKNGGTIPEKAPKDADLDACLQSPEVQYYAFNLHIGQLVDGVDEFYKDFRNKNIQVELAMRYVRDQLKGKSDTELADELASWRQAANK